MKTAMFACLSLVVSVSGANPISTHACQCTSSCETEYFRLPPAELCRVDTTTCIDASEKSEGKDSCSGFWTQVADQVAAWAGFFANEASGLYDKLEGWSKENIQSIPVDEIKTWTTDKLNMIPFDQINQFTQTQFQNLDVQELLASGSDKFASLTASWPKMSEEQWAALLATGQTQWNDIVANMPLDKLAALSTDVMAKFPTEKLSLLKEQLANLKLEDVAAWTGEAWQQIPVDNMAEMSWQALQQVPWSQMGTWTQEQWNKFPVDKLVMFTGEQINKADPEWLAGVGQAYWDKVPVYHIVKFGTELLQSAGFVQNLNSTELGYLSKEQWLAVPIEEITKFTGEQLQAIDYEALGEWTENVWDKVPFDTVAKLVGQQIQQIPANTVANWTQTQWLRFDASGAVMFTGEQLAAGADTLKDLTEEQLSNFDWSTIVDKSNLPPELVGKIQNLAADTTFVELVQTVDEKKDVAVTAYTDWQTKKNSAAATEEEIAAAETNYNEKQQEFEQANAQLEAKTNSMDNEASSAQRAVPISLALALGVMLTM